MEVRSCLIMLVNNTSLCSIQSRYSYMYVGTLSFACACHAYLGVGTRGTAVRPSVQYCLDRDRPRPSVNENNKDRGSRSS